jgi:hypothetical protein
MTKSKQHQGLEAAIPVSLDGHNGMTSCLVATVCRLSYDRSTVDAYTHDTTSGALAETTAL